MKSGYKSKIEMNPETGKKCMIVFYDSEIILTKPSTKRLGFTISEMAR